MSDVEPDVVEDADEQQSEAVAEEEFNWESFAQEYFSETGAADEPEAIEGQTDDTTSDDETAPVEEVTSPQAPPPEFVEVAGRQIPVSEADRVAALYDFVQQYPEQAAQFSSYLMGEMDLVPKGAGQEVPPSTPSSPETPARQPLRDEDLEFYPEPIRERIRAVDAYESRLAQIEQAVVQYGEVAQQQHQQVMAEQARAAQFAINTGTEQFKEKYGIDSEDDMNAILQEAAQLGVTANLAQQYNDPVRAVTESLELAYLRKPEYREREFARREAEAVESRKKDRKRAAISGSGGSVSRTSTPSTSEERREAMVREIEDAMRGRPS